MYYIYGGDCPHCGYTESGGFESEATWHEVRFACPNCETEVTIEVTGGWEDDD